MNLEESIEDKKYLQEEETGLKNASPFYKE